MSRTYTLKKSSTSGPLGAIAYDKSLNEAQRRAVLSSGGPTLVLAGAGSGKTRTLIYRVAHLIEQGVAPEEIVLLTFTNRAAKEMTGRVRDLMPVNLRGLWSGTFHSIGRRILRDHASVLGYPDNFTIIDSEDAETLMKLALASLNVAKSSQRLPKASTLVSVLSASLNTGETVEHLIARRFPHFIDHTQTMYDAMLAYQERKTASGLMDFDDLLFLWQRLFAEHPEIQARYAQRFKHVLVDEYQDTNRVQADLVDRLASAHDNLMVVGDDSQAIYSFRGADFRNIMDFPERHEGCELIKLEQNYRSSPQILALTNASVAHNEERYDKTLTSAQPPGETPREFTCRNERVQSEFIAQRVTELRDEGVELSQVAVLYRAHWQSMELQLELSRRGIPFVVRSGMRFFEQRHVKDVLAFMRVVENPRDELAATRVATMADGIGPATAHKVAQVFAGHGSLSQALQDPALDRVLPSRARASFASMRGLLAKLCAGQLRDDAGASITAVVEDFYQPLVQRIYDAPENRLRELETLAAYGAQQGTVADMLDRLSLTGALNGEDILDVSDEDEKLVLSSIHQSKGLEFHSVFVPWLADERFPSARALRDEAGIEEERRLFYVACTRAQRELDLLWPAQTYMPKVGPTVLRRSLFVEELLNETPAVVHRWQLTSED